MNTLYKYDRQQPLPDHYRILGVTPTAAYREIEAAYWRLAFGAPQERVAELNEAYEVLSDEARRQAYDAQRPHEEPPVQSQAETPLARPREAGSLMARLGWPSA